MAESVRTLPSLSRFFDREGCNLMTMKKPFHKYGLMGKTHEFAAFWLETGMAHKALAEGQTLHTWWQNGSLRTDDALDIKFFINEILQSYCKRIALHQLPMTRGGDEDWMLVSDDLAVHVSYEHRNRGTTVQVWGTNAMAATVLHKVVKARLERKVTRGRIYIVVQGNDGPSLHEMGTAGEDFIADNYRAEVVEGYLHVVEDLKNVDPCGRIVILDGPPGTGKTHMVRALLNAVPKGTFVLIPSNMMSQLGSPSFVKTLLRQQKPGHPLILVVEDADEAIASRKSDNISEISALLNFSDGIFGAMMDLRIIATTNVDANSLDVAVIRAGRLCRRIEVGKLDHVQAETVYKRLGGTKEALFTRGNFYTLGDIYAQAKGSGGVGKGTPRPAKGRLGFALNDVEETPSTPAADLDMKPGDIGVTDEGEHFIVRNDGQLEMVEDGDDDLIDEDPEETSSFPGDEDD
jgi:hypothetical protein